MEAVMMRTHVDDRVLAEMSAEERVDRIGRILLALESDDQPRFNFLEHEREQTSGQSSTR